MNLLNTQHNTANIPNQTNANANGMRKTQFVRRKKNTLTKKKRIERTKKKETEIEIYGCRGHHSIKVYMQLLLLCDTFASFCFVAITRRCVFCVFCLAIIFFVVFRVCDFFLFSFHFFLLLSRCSFIRLPFRLFHFLFYHLYHDTIRTRRHQLDSKSKLAFHSIEGFFFSILCVCVCFEVVLGAAPIRVRYVQPIW